MVFNIKFINYIFVSLFDQLFARVKKCENYFAVKTILLTHLKKFKVVNIFI